MAQFFKFKDSTGKEFEYFSVYTRQVKSIVVASYPAYDATVFSAAVSAKRCIVGFSTTDRQTKTLINHHRKQFGAYDIEIIDSFEIIDIEGN